MSGSIEVIFDVVRDGWAASPWTPLIVQFPIAGAFLFVAGPLLQRLMKKWPALRVLGDLPERLWSLRALAAVFVTAGPVIYVFANAHITGAADRVASGKCVWIEGTLESVDIDAFPLSTLHRTTWGIGGESLAFGPLSSIGEYNPANRTLSPARLGDRLRLCQIGDAIWRVERIRQ